jgi:hypothetical protein
VHFGASVTTSNELSNRNNFENSQSRKAILKSTLAEIQQEIGSL